MKLYINVCEINDFPLNCSRRPRVLVPVWSTSGERGPRADVESHGNTRFKLTTLCPCLKYLRSLLLDFPILATCGNVAAETLDHWANQPEQFSGQLLKAALQPGVVTPYSYCISVYVSERVMPQKKNNNRGNVT